MDKDYEFTTEEGTKTLAELFDGRDQLLVYHFMFGPTVEGWPEAGCPGFTEEERKAGSGFNFGTPKHAGEIDLRRDELHGLSAFAHEDGLVYHTYSTYDRGTNVLNATWQLLDRSPQGRGDDPEGWPRRHDEYAKGAP